MSKYVQLNMDVLIPLNHAYWGRYIFVSYLYVGIAILKGSICGKWENSIFEILYVSL